MRWRTYLLSGVECAHRLGKSVKSKDAVGEPDVEEEEACR